MKLSILLLLSATQCVTAFVPPSPWGSSAISQRTTTTSSTSLKDIIKGEEVGGSDFDEGQGGVRLAMESAIKITGTLEKSSSSPPKILDIANPTRYTKMTEFNMEDDDVIKATMESSGVTLICTGTGKEMYKDPGSATEAEITFAPVEAARSALSSTPSASLSNAKNVVLNFVGGDELILNEVLEGAVELIDGLDIGDGCMVNFNSLCHSSFPVDMASVTVVATKGEAASGDEGEGVAGSVGGGEMYFQQGKWWTVVKEDVNSALF
uniref:Uncharacterized protein n=1 Tax=Ditylum brightwellii TaxID=49249 RepID=A0A7S4UZL3_9STRA|mmetsp:Transcript_37185/g.49348  ORF Transcript_37185/g.49348 Transcript_37185/m.49348 type:complete len:266 (-) Transcript_37185:47-844(-)